MPVGTPLLNIANMSLLARSPKRPMNDNAILAAMRRMEIPKDQMSGHGFRAMTRTILDEVLDYPVAIIKRPLTHLYANHANLDF